MPARPNAVQASRHIIRRLPRRYQVGPASRSAGAGQAGCRVFCVAGRWGSHDLSVAFALTGPKADGCKVLTGMLTVGPDLITTRPGHALIGDKDYYGRGFEAARRLRARRRGG